MHETKLHAWNFFITCTYDDQHLPADGSLSYEHHTNFMKRLRHHAAPAKVRFLMCGEYGEDTGRPHLHYIAHGLPLTDLKIQSGRGQNQHTLHTSKQLEEIWGMGFCPVAQVTHETASYVASYTLKRKTGEAAENYIRPHPLTGEPFKVLPEFSRMSRRPGLGAEWLERYGSTDLSGDHLVILGRTGARKVPIPRYYLSKLSPEQLGGIKARQQNRAEQPQSVADHTEARLLTRNKSAAIKAARRKRNGA